MQRGGAHVSLLLPYCCQGPTEGPPHFGVTEAMASYGPLPPCPVSLLPTPNSTTSIKAHMQQAGEHKPYTTKSKNSLSRICIWAFSQHPRTPGGLACVSWLLFIQSAGAPTASSSEMITFHYCRLVSHFLPQVAKTLCFEASPLLNTPSAVYSRLHFPELKPPAMYSDSTSFSTKLAHKFSHPPTHLHNFCPTLGLY